ncbi:YegP family protein [uncultured Dokdonia sp.]|uniref:YegP family protein n=1 Tax=uncultured Dokdonia sp. TaxID=575653 RepID=UPI00262B33F1|nr:YegP family protein [uncultured Dokdonia sp.]
MGKFEIYRAKNNDYFFRLKAMNGQIILASEGYKAKNSCNNGIQSVKRNSINLDMYARKIAKNGQHYFVLKSINGEIIGKSEFYSTKAGLENGIFSVKHNAPSADVFDLT